MTPFVPAAALSTLTQQTLSLKKPETVALAGQPDAAHVELSTPQMGTLRAADSACLHLTSMQYAAQSEQNLAEDPAYYPDMSLSLTKGLRPSTPAARPPALGDLAVAGQHRRHAWLGASSLAAWATLALAALAAAPAHAQVVGPVSKLVVTQNGQGPADSGCASFRLSAKQAQAFFKRAVLITERQNHDHFDRGPCTVSGSFKTRFDSWEWEIRNGGTAAIMSSNGDSFLLADPRQASAPN